MMLLVHEKGKNRNRQDPDTAIRDDENRALGFRLIELFHGDHPLPGVTSPDSKARSCISS